MYEVDIETQGSGAQLFFDFKNRTLYYNDKANNEQFLRLINYFESPNNKTGGQVAISFSNEKKSYLPWQKLDSITVQKNPDGKKFLRLEGLNFYKVFADYANPLNKHFRLRITSQNFNQPTEWRGFSINTHYNPSQKKIFSNLYEIAMRGNTASTQIASSTSPSQSTVSTTELTASQREVERLEAEVAALKA